LYDFEGALRVIAKITKERDDARDALSRVTVSGVTNGGGDEMVIDAQPLPGIVVEKITARSQELSAGRRKRKAPEGWATSAELQVVQPTEIPEAALPGSRALAVDQSGDLALFGGIDGVAIVYSVSEKKTVTPLKCGSGAVTDAIFWDSKPVIALSTGEVKVFAADGEEVGHAKVHAGACTGLTLHPTGDLLASVGADKSYVAYDLPTMKTLTRVFTDSRRFSPWPFRTLVF
jgi:pre-mRNA-processing factor 19